LLGDKMAKYKVELTGMNTNDLKVLSQEEQTNLFLKMKSGDVLAKEELIYGNLRLVLSVLKKFKNQNLNLDDLFQIGVIGLIKAIDNFDLSYNLKLSTYAIPLIVGEIKRYIRDNQSSLRVSRSMRDRAYQILSFKENYFQKYGVEPSCDEIAKNFGITVYEVSNALDSLREPVSIFEPIYNDGGEPLYIADQLADKKELNDERDQMILLKRSLYKLKEREKNILIERYIIGKTQMEIAEQLDISQAQVSRIEKSAIKNMQRMMK